MLCASLLGQQLGDPPAPWFDAATNTCGGILYIATGALVIEFYTNASPPAQDAGLAMGSFSLITGPHNLLICGQGIAGRPRRKRLKFQTKTQALETTISRMSSLN